VAVALSCTGPSGVALTYSVTSRPAHGTLGAINQTTGAVTYMPRAGFSGSDTFTYKATDMGGSSNLAAVTITASKPIPVITSTMSWNFATKGALTIVESMIVSGVPASAHVTVSCKGSGCGFRSKTVTPPVIHCKTKTCKHKPAKHSTTVSLTSLFAHHRLKSGTTVTVSIQEKNAIGKTYIFTMRKGKQPAIKIS
jgi:hypothetical protein